MRGMTACKLTGVRRMITSLTKLELFQELDEIRGRVRSQKDYEVLTYLRRLAAMHTADTGLHAVLEDPLKKEGSE